MVRGSDLFGRKLSGKRITHTGRHIRHLVAFSFSLQSNEPKEITAITIMTAKNFWIPFLSLAFLVMGSLAWADTKTERHYDSSGKYAGKSVSNGKGTIRHYDRSGRSTGRETTAKQSSRQYDASGRYQGRSTLSNSTQRNYDRSGRYTGRSTSNGSTVRHYDSSGRYKGKSVRSGNSIRHYDRSGRFQGQSK